MYREEEEEEEEGEQGEGEEKKGDEGVTGEEVKVGEEEKASKEEAEDKGKSKKSLVIRNIGVEMDEVCMYVYVCMHLCMYHHDVLITMLCVKTFNWLYSFNGM